MSRLVNHVYSFARQFVLGIDTAHAMFHGVPVSERSRQLCAPRSAAGAHAEL